MTPDLFNSPSVAHESFGGTHDLLWFDGNFDHGQGMRRYLGKTVFEGQLDFAGHNPVGLLGIIEGLRRVAA